MASSVFYKFKSQRDESRVTFDGTAISVFDLKKEIILANSLGKANDFDLYVYDASTNQGEFVSTGILNVVLILCVAYLEYKDDSQLIPRSSSIVVKRLPSQRPGKGKAGMYIAGTNGSAPFPTSEPVQRPGGSTTWHKGAMSKRFDVKEESPAPKSSTPVRSYPKLNVPLANWRVLHTLQSNSVAIPKNSVTKDDEAAAMAAMFQAQTANWEETQEKMSQLVSRLRGSSFVCSRTMSHEHVFVFPSVQTVLHVYIPILEGRRLAAVESPSVRINPMPLIVLYRPHTCVTVVVRKVRFTEALAR
jgi:protein MPE1